MKKITKQLGISLLEVMLSLSIIAIILVMATKYFFVANRSDKINTVRQQIGEVIAAIESWKSEHPTYSDSPTLTIGTLSQQGFLAKTNLMSNSGTANATLNNPWGYRISIDNVGDNSVMVKTNLPGANDCRALRNSFPDAQPCNMGQFVLPVPMGTDQSGPNF